MQIRNCVLAGALFTALSLVSQSTNTADNAVWYNARHGDSSAMNQLGIWYYSGNKVNRDYSQAYQWWRQGALLGNVKAVANLGVCYQYGKGVEADSVAAMQLYLTAIGAGQSELLDQRSANAKSNAFDAMLAGTCYERGIGVPRDIKKAAEMYVLAAEQGSVDGMRLAADALLSAGVPIEAMQMYDRAADNGDAESTFMAGLMRMGGMGVTSNTNQGIYLIRKAADAGLTEAKTYLGTACIKGESVLRDLDRASKLLSEACQSGDQTAMWQYGQLLRSQGDYDRALYWLSLAAQAAGQQQFDSMYKALPNNDPFKLYIDGMRHYINGNYQQALMQFKDIDASRSNAGRIMEAAVLAAPGNTKGDAKKAVKILTKLSETSPQAAYLLAGLYNDGSGVVRDTSHAISLYRQAANAGYGPAQDALAGIYYDGKITTYDYNGAIGLYDKAYAQRMLSAEGARRLRDHYSALDPAKAARLDVYDAADPVGQILGKAKP